MKHNDIYNGYWIVAGDASRVYSSAAHDYVPAADPTYVAWASDGSIPETIDTEANLGAVFCQFNALRPIPPAVLAGYQDAQMLLIAQQPDFKVWLDLYATVLHPTPDEAQIRARIRSRL